VSRSWSQYPVLDDDPVTETTAFLLLLLCGIGVVLAFVVGQNWQDHRRTDDLRERCALVAEPAFIDECVEASR